MGLGCSKILVPHQLRSHRHWHAAIHHGLDKEAAGVLWADSPTEGVLPRLLEHEAEASRRYLPAILFVGPVPKNKPTILALTGVTEKILLTI